MLSKAVLDSICDSRAVKQSLKVKSEKLQKIMAVTFYVNFFRWFKVNSLDLGWDIWGVKAGKAGRVPWVKPFARNTHTSFWLICLVSHYKHVLTFSVESSLLKAVEGWLFPTPAKHTSGEESLLWNAFMPGERVFVHMLVFKWRAPKSCTLNCCNLCLFPWCAGEGTLELFYFSVYL